MLLFKKNGKLLLISHIGINYKYFHINYLIRPGNYIGPQILLVTKMYQVFRKQRNHELLGANK